MTLIHVNVEERVYTILSLAAENLGMSVGQYCADIVTDCAGELAYPTIKKQTDVEPKAKSPFTEETPKEKDESEPE